MVQAVLILTFYCKFRVDTDSDEETDDTEAKEEARLLPNQTV